MATAAKKAAATAKKKAAAKRRTRRQSAPAKPMALDVRELGSAIAAFATERAMASEKLGVVGTNTKELKGRRHGMATILKLDDGRRVTVTFAVRSR